MTAKKRVWKGIFVALLMVGAVFVGLFSINAEAATITVPTDYSTISAAIAAASTGDTIQILDGTYDVTSEITVNKAVNIVGVGTVIVDGGSTASIIFNVTAANANISNIQVQHAASIGINIAATSVKIDNCTVSYNPIGINIETTGDSAVIENCSISNNGDIGIKVAGATVKIRFNTIEYNGNGATEGGIVVTADDTNNLTVAKNDIRYNSYNGIYIYDDNENAVYHEDMVINYNNIYDNSLYGLNYQESATNGSSLDAQYNWWGDPTGCYSPDTGTTYGYNRDASGDELNCPNVEVDYDPWLDAPWDVGGHYALRSYNVWEGTTTVVHTYKEIYAALSSANTADGDTINIRRGHYHLRTAAMDSTDKCLLIQDSITLRAMEPTGTNSYTYGGSHPDGADLSGSAPDIYILDAWEASLSAGTGDGIISLTSAKDFVNITGFTIRRGGSGTYGIHVINTSANYTHIWNCVIELCEDGIVFNGGQKPKIWNCIIRNNTVYGIKYLTGDYGIIANNTIEYNGDGTDNYGGIYLPNTDKYVCIVGNTIKNNDDDGIYIASSTGSYESVIHYNNFKDNVVYAIESAGATVHAEYNCWYNSTAGAWGGKPGDAGVDNYSASVTVTPYYNGSVTAAYAAYAVSGAGASYDARGDVDILATFTENHTYNPFLMFAKFSALPIGTAPSGYTPLTKYLAFNISGRGSAGLTTGSWILIRIYYRTSEIPSGVSEGRIKGVWHYNGTKWVKVTGMVKSTTDTGSYGGYVQVNFTANPTSPILILGNKLPQPKFTYSPSNPTTNDEIEFDASASTDPDGSISTYSWNFGDGTTGTGVKPTHQYDEAGTYTVTLTVTDNAGDEEKYTKKITVTAAAAPGLGVAPGEGRYDLTVSVVKPDGMPVEGAIVSLYSGNVLLAYQFTDASGSVVFSDVEGTYKITAEKQGYRKATSYVTVTEDTSKTIVLGKVPIHLREYVGFTMFEWIVLFFLILAFILMLAFAVTEGWKKYWYVPIILNVLALLFAVIFPLAGLMVFSIWFVVAPILLILITAGIFKDEIKRYGRW